jgi:hypothetical protein
MQRRIIALVPVLLLALHQRSAVAQDVPLVWGGMNDPVTIRGRECRVPNGMVNFFHESDPLFRHSIRFYPLFVRPGVNVLAGHGGPGGGCGWRVYEPGTTTYDAHHCSNAQRAEILGMYAHEVNRAGRNPVGLQLNCFSGIPGGNAIDGYTPSMAERAASCLATTRRDVPGMWNVQIGMVGEVGTPRCGSTLHVAQNRPLLGNPQGVILYYGIPLKDGTSAVEAVYVPDGNRVLANVSGNPDRPLRFGPWMHDDHLGAGCRPSWGSALGDRLRMCNPGQMLSGANDMGMYGPIALAGGGLTLDGVGRCLQDDPRGIPEASMGTMMFTAGGSLTLYGAGNLATGAGFYGTGSFLAGGGSTLAGACLPATACVAVATTAYCGTRAADDACGGRLSDGVATGLCAVGDTCANLLWRWWAPGCEWNYELTSTSAGMFGENARGSLRGPPRRRGGGAVRAPAVDPPFEGEDEEGAGCAVGGGGGLGGMALLSLLAWTTSSRRRRGRA